jgi:uncharacterized repeat protein (TIGR03847 family)
MPTIVHGFDWPDRLVVGTVGLPGQRSFYLQARDGARVVSVALEKEQSELLAEKIDEMLDGLRDTDGNRFSVPTGTPLELVDNDPLDQPVEPEFRTGAMSLGFDPTTSQIVIEAFPIEDADDTEDGFDPFDGPISEDGLRALGLDADEVAEVVDAAADYEPPEMLQVRIPVGTARAFAKRTLEVVGAGRPLCPLCGEPMDPSGHVCALPDDFR